MTLVSVVVPCFNASKTIFQTLNSIQKQEMQDFECIVINDFSSDNSEKIISKFSQFDSRFKLINLESNKGVSFARNKGLENSSGRFISFLDSDDIWHRNFLKYSIDLRKGVNLAMTHCPYIRFKKKKNNYVGKTIYPPQLINADNIGEKNHLPLLTVVLDREIIGDFKFKKIRPEDYNLWLELIEDRNLHSTIFPFTAAFYRISENQRSNNKMKSIKRIYNLFKEERKLSEFNSIKKTLKWAFNNVLEKKGKFYFIKSFSEDISKEFFHLLEN